MSVATLYDTTLRSAPCSAHSGIRIGQVLADHALERPAVVRAIEMAEHVVQGSVLEENYDDVIEGVRAFR
jgi:hypothetical protein